VLQGITLEPGQELVLERPIERVDFAREIVNVAYASGASHVTALWHDDSIEQMAYQNEPLANFENPPE
jgi:aminopeptidase